MKQLELLSKRKKKRGQVWGRPISTHIGARRKREAFKKHQPLHITLRLREGLPNLRCKRGTQLLKRAIVGARECGINVVHFAILSNHVHLIVEAGCTDKLYRGMKSFCSRLGIHLRRWVKELGLAKTTELGLFRGRYHVQILKTPNQVKQALKYVLLNPAKHFKRKPYIDAYTSGALFKHWRQVLGYNLLVSQNWVQAMEEHLRSFIGQPNLWLLSSAYG